MTQSGFIGVWNVSIATPIGKLETAFEIEHDGDGVMGRAHSGSQQSNGKRQH